MTKQQAPSAADRRPRLDRALPGGAMDGKLIQVDVARNENEKPVRLSRRGAGLYGLRKSGAITEAHVWAAEQWALDYETGVHGASDPERSSKGGGDIHDMMLARSRSVTRFNAVRAVLGGTAVELLFLLTIEGLSLTAIAQRRRSDRGRVTGMIEIVLEQLADFFSQGRIAA